MSFHAPKEFMIEHPQLGVGSGNSGFFRFASPYKKDTTLYVMASDGAEWEHVSVSVSKKRCPYWEEMCFIKEYFWDAEDTVVQFHPPKSEYVNNRNYCLHMWRPIGWQIKLPPSILVGVI